MGGMYYFTIKNIYNFSCLFKMFNFMKAIYGEFKLVLLNLYIVHLSGRYLSMKSLYKIQGLLLIGIKLCMFKAIS